MLGISAVFIPFGGSGLVWLGGNRNRWVACEEAREHWVRALDAFLIWDMKDRVGLVNPANRTLDFGVSKAHAPCISVPIPCTWVL